MWSGTLDNDKHVPNNQHLLMGPPDTGVGPELMMTYFCEEINILYVFSLTIPKQDKVHTEYLMQMILKN